MLLELMQALICSLTHGPPHGVLDLTKHAARAGCPALSQRVNELRPRLHAFGHIHEARGAYVHLWDNANKPGASQLVDDLPAGEQTVFVNAANSPSGPTAVRTDGTPVFVGGPGVQPVIVDLTE
jgi:hypothetical protein